MKKLYIENLYFFLCFNFIYVSRAILAKKKLNYIRIPLLNSAEEATKSHDN